MDWKAYFCRMNKLQLFLILCLFSIQSLYAQVNVRDSIVPGWLITIRSGAFQSGMDLGNRFDESFSIGAGTFYKTSKNWIWGANGDFWFGPGTNERFGILQALGSESGEVLDHFGNFSDVMTYQRGWLIGIDFGKIFNNLGHNANSGMFVTVGGGYLQHRIRLESINRNSIIYQIEGDYQRGYDRMNIGWMSRLNIGYIHSHVGKTVNFMVSGEIMYGESSSVRGFNWDTGLPDNGTFRNLTYGIRLSWFLPIYDNNAQTFFFN
jgi:hypothetical protein